MRSLSIKIKQHLLKPFQNYEQNHQNNCLLISNKHFFKFDELFVSANQMGGVIRGEETSWNNICNLFALLFGIITKQTFKSYFLVLYKKRGNREERKSKRTCSHCQLQFKTLPNSQLSNISITENARDRSVTLNGEW